MFKFLTLAALLTAAAGDSLRATKPGERKLIVGGQDAKQDWFVQFGGNNCGGTLFDEKHVLTSATCVSPAAPRVVYINAQTRDGEGYEYEVECAIKHPDYDGSTRIADIAVIKLKQRCASNLVNLANTGDDLTDADVTNAKTLWEIGLGDTTGNGDFPSQLKEAEMNLITDAECATQYGDQVQAGKHVCVNFPSAQRGYCSGDGGTPLMENNGNNDKQYGVATPPVNATCDGGDGSFSNCGDPSFADVYADVAVYHDWIMAQVDASTDTCDSQVDCLQGAAPPTFASAAWDTFTSLFP